MHLTHHRAVEQTYTLGANAVFQQGAMTLQELRAKALRAAVKMEGRNPLPSVFNTKVLAEHLAHWMLTGQSMIDLRVTYKPATEFAAHERVASPPISSGDQPAQ